MFGRRYQRKLAEGKVPPSRGQRNAALGAFGFIAMGAVLIASGRVVGFVTGAVSVVFGSVGLLQTWKVTRHRRILPPAIQKAVGAMPQFRPGQHRITVVLRDGSVHRNVYVAYGLYVTGVGWSPIVRFRTDDITAVLAQQWRGVTPTGRCRTRSGQRDGHTPAERANRWCKPRS